MKQLEDYIDFLIETDLQEAFQVFQQHKAAKRVKQVFAHEASNEAKVN